MGNCYGALTVYLPQKEEFVSAPTPVHYRNSFKRWSPTYDGDILKMLFFTSLTS